MTTSTTGFSVIYRWRVHPGQEDVFLEAWATLTVKLRDKRGALGSRLHRSENGDWVAYAQWPTRQDWERTRQIDSVDPDASARMRQAVAETFEPVLLNPVKDLLVQGGIETEGE